MPFWRFTFRLLLKPVKRVHGLLAGLSPKGLRFEQFLTGIEPLSAQLLRHQKRGLVSGYRTVDNFNLALAGRGMQWAAGVVIWNCWASACNPPRFFFS
jgi:hypothetical protein